MRILQINATYGKGSTGVIVKDLAQLATKMGHESYVAYSTPTGDPVPNSYIIGNLRDRKIHALLSRIHGKQAYFSQKATRGLIDFIHEIHPDIVHLHNLHNNYLHLNTLLKFLYKNDINTVITMHDCWFFTGGCFHFANIGCNRWQTTCGECPKKLLDTKAYFGDRSKQILTDRKKYFANFRNIVFVGVSNWISKEFRHSNLSYHRNITIHNGIDTTIFYPVSTTLRKDLGIEKEFVILGAANKWLDPANKPLVEAIIKAYGTTCEIVIFGCPSNTAAPFKGVKTIGYANGPKKMAEIFAMANVFVNCSHEDTLPTVNLECQACGTPVIGFDNTGIPETLAPYSRKVATDDIPGVLAAIDAIKQDRLNLNRQALHDWVSTNYGKDANYNQYIELYQELIDSK